jgi:uncharacterized protein DUF4255/carboxypeptidase family protein
VLADLDETLRQLLIRDVPLDLAEVDVSFDAPDREWSGRLSRPTVNCYLYDVRENHEYRETDYELDRSNGNGVRIKGPLRIDVSYQVTVWARAADDEHRLLWRVLSALIRHPILPHDLLQGELKDQPFPIRAQGAQPELGPKNAAELWQALDNRIRPGLTYVVTLALDPQVVFTSPLVFTRVAHLLFEEQQDAEALEIGGWVRDRQHPDQGVVGARVRVRGSGAEATTDQDGRFMLRNVRRGTATLVVAAPGRKEVARRVDIPAAQYEVEI